MIHHGVSKQAGERLIMASECKRDARATNLTLCRPGVSGLSLESMEGALAVDKLTDLRM